METALQHGHFAPAQRAQQQAAGVAFHRGQRKVRNVGVVDGVLNFYFLGQSTQAGAEDYARFRLEVVGMGLDVSGGFVELLHGLRRGIDATKQCCKSENKLLYYAKELGLRK